MQDQNNDNELKQLQQKQHEAAIEALTFLVSKYSPAANKDEADTFFTTNEISQAIAQHTGVTLPAAEIYELMVQMKYTYENVNGLEFNWLLKK